MKSFFQGLGGSSVFFILIPLLFFMVDRWIFDGYFLYDTIYVFDSKSTRAGVLGFITFLSSAVFAFVFMILGKQTPQWVRVVLVFSIILMPVTCAGQSSY